MRRKSLILGENDKIFSGFLLVQWVPVSDPTLDIKGQPDRGTGPGAAQMNISKTIIITTLEPFNCEKYRFSTVFAYLF